MNTYTTKQIAVLTGVHPNTVRLYEAAGFIAPPERRANGYRVFTQLHLRQMALARLALRAEVLQNGLRMKAIEIIRHCAACDFSCAIESARAYEAMLERETENARAAIITVEAILGGKRGSGGLLLRRREAADKLGVTIDTLRNWELNGLITVKRRQNGYRVYDASDLERLNIIRVLRCADYSLSAILRLVNGLDRNEAAPVEQILNTPSKDEELVSVCDRLIVSLENTRKDAQSLRALLEIMQSEN